MRDYYYKLEIESIANIILQKYNINNKINPVIIANNLNLKTMEANLSHNNIIGILDINNNSIIVNASDDIFNKRFYVARLIGHYVLHVKGFNNTQNKVIKNKYRYNLYRDSVTTLQFNVIYLESFYFALNLLLPKDIFLHAKANGIQLHHTNFDVTETIFGMRLNYL